MLAQEFNALIVFAEHVSSSNEIFIHIGMFID